MTTSLSGCIIGKWAFSSSESYTSFPRVTSSSSSSSIKPPSVSTSYKHEGDATSKEVELQYSIRDYIDNNYYSNVDCMPNKGNVKVLVIPVRFSDTSTYCTQDVKDDIGQAFFGTSDTTGWHSVSSYYKEESNGQLVLSGCITPWYPCGYDSRTFSSSQSKQLATAAAEWGKEQLEKGGYDITDYDLDGNGYLDCVALIYGQKSNANGNESLWQYTGWCTNKASTTDPTCSTYLFSSYDTMYECNYLDIDAHTYIHEMGHVLGLEDYYDYNESSNKNPAGGFSMQDYNVGGHDIFSKMLLGWTKPIVVDGTGSCTIDIAPSTSNGNCIVLTNKESKDFTSPFDEYIVLEYFTATGLNELDTNRQYKSSRFIRSSYPKGTLIPGIRVWHVDARLLKNYTGTTNALIVTEPKEGADYIYCCSNSSGNSDNACLDKRFSNFKLLNNLSKSKVNNFDRGGYFGDSDIYTKGDTFKLSDYSSFLYYGNKLNNGEELNMTFSVENITTSKATIKVTR